MFDLSAGIILWFILVFLLVGLLRRKRRKTRSCRVHKGRLIKSVEALSKRSALPQGTLIRLETIKKGLAKDRKSL